MYYRVQRLANSPSETLLYIQTQVEALISQHSNLMLHKRAIERQLASIAAQIHEPGALLAPHNVFLLLEMRGSGGVREQLEQIAHIVHEQGYWKPKGRVQNYRLQDVYHLGQSAQRLFDDYAELDRRVEQLHVRIEHVKRYRQVEAETCPQEVFECLATASDRAEIQGEVNAIFELLEQAKRPGWLRWLFGRRSRKMDCVY